MDVRPIGLAGFVGVFSDGSALLVKTDRLQRLRTGTYRGPDEYLHVDRLGRIVNRWNGLPSWETTPAEDRMVRVQFGQDPERALGSDYWIFGAGDRMHFLRFESGEEEPTLLLRGNSQRRVITDQSIAEFREQFRYRYQDSDRRAIAEAMDLHRFPERMPAHGRIVISSDDHLWVQRPPLPEEELAEWTVYSLTGDAVGTIALPKEWRIRQVRDSKILAIVVDRLDIPSVVVQRFARGSGGN